MSDPETTHEAFETLTAHEAATVRRSFGVTDAIGHVPPATLFPGAMMKEGLVKSRLADDQFAKTH